MLYLIATPIGNLQDITLRALETIKSVDYLLCEDTRHSSLLLSHYNINKPLKSFHKFNEAAKEKIIIEDLLNGKTIGLVTDAGTPGISDPGTRLVQQCIQKNISVTSIPGPCALIMALSCSGLDTSRFQFYGFLPRKAAELRRTLQEILAYPATTICYESPFRLQEVLQQINLLAPSREIVVARELTKKFEEIVRGTSSKLIVHWENRQVKGELVLLISGETNSASEWENLSPEEHVRLMEEAYSLSRHDAIKMVAELRGVPKRTIYNKMCDKNYTAGH